MKKLKDFYPHEPLKTIHRAEPKFLTAQEISVRDNVSTFHKEISPT